MSQHLIELLIPAIPGILTSLAGLIWALRRKQ